MENPVFLSLSLCFLILFNACLATDNYIRQGKSRDESQFRYRHCQLDALDALEPTHRIESEGGVIESWDPNHQQFRCAEVAVFRYIIDPNGLVLPQYSNAPRLMFIERGRGFQGVVLPGCPETYQESEQSSREFQDRHQKVRQIRADDIFAVPAGAVHWIYNDGNEKLVIVVLQDVGSHANQLDLFPRTFYLAGNPEDEFEQSSQAWEREGQTEGRGRKEGSSNKKNIFFGFPDQTIADILNINLETARKIRAEDDYRRNIIKVEGFLEVIRPPGSRASCEGCKREWDVEEEEQRAREIERERESSYGRGGRGEWTTNGLEETFCSMRLRENIGDASRADIYVPGAGRISTANSHHLPVLRWFQLSAERGRLYRNAMYTPHWNQNAHSVIYAIRGRARVQVVDDRGQTVFNGELRQHQLLVVPQNFVLVKKAGDEGFDWIAFKTNDDAMISPLAGKTSVIRAMPAQVLAAAFRITNREALALKHSRKELTLFPGSRSSGRREDAVQAM